MQAPLTITEFIINNKIDDFTSAMVYSTGKVLIDSSADLPLEIQFRIKLDSLKTSSLPVEFNEITFAEITTLR